MTTLEIILSFSLLGVIAGSFIFMKNAYDFAQEAYEDASAILDIHILLENIIKYNIVNSDKNSVIFPKKAFGDFIEKESDLYQLEFEDGQDNITCWAIKNP